MRMLCRGSADRDHGFVLLDAVLAVLILVVAIAAAMLTMRAAATAMVGQASRIDSILGQRNEQAQITTEYPTE